MHVQDVMMQGQVVEDFLHGNSRDPYAKSAYWGFSLCKSTCLEVFLGKMT